MPKIKLTAYSWGQPGKNGRNLRRRGDVVDVTEEQAARLVKLGAAIRVKEKANKSANEPSSPTENDELTVDGHSTEAKDSTEEIAKPRPTATKPTWIKYAIQEGMDGEELEQLTRDEIAAKFL
ncbi:hypothetical protein [Corynebacterium stationis]|uniref:hypothetical protein n=1 Tax=Corynebacterium stationis TaxID=1705 RepID=UPI00076F7542|nr:hypothetical protein [Corynebacterium stationis]AMJ43683.1 hypothetical protein AW169_01225 [Corynebacterium stationis]AQX70130.1 hypothetical protein CA21670_00350 [Corynebacterium stationis]ASJ17834.1 hypothetical protein BA700_01225 [Corynebacterium stationis]